MLRYKGITGVLAATLLCSTAIAAPLNKRAPVATITFDMVPSAASCVGGSSAHVVVRSFGPVEVMSIEAKGLPANTNFDVFVIQQPKGPFGMAWYQGDL